MAVKVSCQRGIKVDLSLAPEPTWKDYPDSQKAIHVLIVKTLYNLRLQVLHTFRSGCCIAFLDVFDYDDEFGGEKTKVKGSGC